MDERHVFDPDAAEKLEDVIRYRYLSRDELVAALDADDDAAVVDLGSGTGFYTRDVAATVGSVKAVDMQPAMHDHFRSAGLPDNVDVVTADIGDLPFDDSTHDAAFSTMVFHEFASEETLREIGRVLRPGARLVIADWSREGDGERGPPLDGRYAPSEAVDLLEISGYNVTDWSGRQESFLVTATAPR